MRQNGLYMRSGTQARSGSVDDFAYGVFAHGDVEVPFGKTCGLDAVGGKQTPAARHAVGREPVVECHRQRGGVPLAVG